MPAHKSLPEPSVADPLSETTLERRVWGAYLRAGFSRAQWGRALGIKRYQTLIELDKAERPWELNALAAAAQLVGYSLDQLYYGHAGRVNGHATRSAALNADGIVTALNELGADDVQREALAEYKLSRAGMYASVTREFVEVFIATFTACTRRGMSRANALIEAASNGRNARMLGGTVAAGGRPVSARQLEALGPGLRAIDPQTQPRARKR